MSKKAWPQVAAAAAVAGGVAYYYWSTQRRREAGKEKAPPVERLTQPKAVDGKGADKKDTKGEPAQTAKQGEEGDAAAKEETPEPDSGKKRHRSLMFVDPEYDTFWSKPPSTPPDPEKLKGLAAPEEYKDPFWEEPEVPHRRVARSVTDDSVATQRTTTRVFVETTTTPLDPVSLKSLGETKPKKEDSFLVVMDEVGKPSSAKQRVKREARPGSPEEAVFVSTYLTAPLGAPDDKGKRRPVTSGRPKLRSTRAATQVGDEVLEVLEYKSIPHGSGETDVLPFHKGTQIYSVKRAKKALGDRTIVVVSDNARSPTDPGHVSVSMSRTKGTQEDDDRNRGGASSCLVRQPADSLAAHDELLKVLAPSERKRRPRIIVPDVGKMKPGRFANRRPKIAPRRKLNATSSFASCKDEGKETGAQSEGSGKIEPDSTRLQNSPKNDGKIQTVTERQKKPAAVVSQESSEVDVNKNESKEEANSEYARWLQSQRAAYRGTHTQKTAKRIFPKSPCESSLMI